MLFYLDINAHHWEYRRSKRCDPVLRAYRHSPAWTLLSWRLLILRPRRMDAQHTASHIKWSIWTRSSLKRTKSLLSSSLWIRSYSTTRSTRNWLRRRRRTCTVRSRQVERICTARACFGHKDIYHYHNHYPLSLPLRIRYPFRTDSQLSLLAGELQLGCQLQPAMHECKTGHLNQSRWCYCWWVYHPFTSRIYSKLPMMPL